jgi:hypothetical protein
MLSVLQVDPEGRPPCTVGTAKRNERASRLNHLLSPGLKPVGRNASEAKDMRTKKSVELLKEGDLVAEVPVELLYDDNEWSPYLSSSDLQKLDAVRLALKNGDVHTAAKDAKIYTLKPVAAE